MDCRSERINSVIAEPFVSCYSKIKCVRMAFDSFCLNNMLCNSKLCVCVCETFQVTFCRCFTFADYRNCIKQKCNIHSADELFLW